MSKPKDKIGKVVWISCRGHTACEGNQAKVEMVRKVNGSQRYRYRCMKCGRSFVITV